MAQRTDSEVRAADADDGYPDRLGRDWCVRCREFKHICCGSTTFGFWCEDCCPHPYDDHDDDHAEEV